MKKTQQVIILLGQEDEIRISFNFIRGFKAVTIVTNLKDEIVQNVRAHNKNVVFFATTYELYMQKYNPVVVNLTTFTSIDDMALNINNVLSDFPKLMESKNIDIGDHESEDSKSSEAVKADCLLCKIAKGENKKPEHVLYESKSFYVVPGLGAFFDGYVMIVPKEHVMSIAEVDEETFNEFLQVLNDWRFILESIYHKKIFVFECGSGKNGGGKHATSIVHAHVHLAPTDMPVLYCVQKSGLHPALIKPDDVLKDYGEYPYMLYIDQEDTWFITSDPQTYFPRQHPRQVLADYMGLGPEEYNWRTNPLRYKMDIIAYEIQSFLRDNFDSLPKWIQKNTAKFLNS